METTAASGAEEPHRRKAGSRKKALNAQELIELALRENGDDENAATVSLFDTLVDTEPMDYGLLREVIALAVYWTRRRRHVALRARSRYRTAAAAADPESIHSLGVSLIAPMLDFMLTDGTALRHASAAQVEENRDYYLKQGRTMMHRGRFLSAIRERMDPEKSVAGSIDEGTARQLFEEARDSDSDKS